MFESSLTFLERLAVYLLFMLEFFKKWNLLRKATTFVKCNILRPFPTQEFDHIQFTNTKGEGLEDLTTCMTVGIYRVDITQQNIHDSTNGM